MSPRPGAAGPEAVLLDVRPVAPKHRFERIMGTYDALDVGEPMELVVDHDPRCMYYTLLAERGGDTFHFEYLEEGPLTWRVRVTPAPGGEERAGAEGDQPTPEDPRVPVRDSACDAG